MMKEKIKEILRHSFFLRTAIYIFKGFLCGIKSKAGLSILYDSGAVHKEFEVSQSNEYIETVFSDYKKYGGFDRFKGRVAEVGPGDSAGVALLIRNDGADHVDLIDRFYTARDLKRQNLIYESLSSRHGLDQFKVGEQWSESSISGIKWKTGKPAEVNFGECFGKDGQTYDFIVSRAVLEHLYDPRLGLEMMVKCSKPGAVLLHKIDLRDHGLYSPFQHQLKFLEIPERLYKIMSYHLGLPNRVRLPQYRKLLDKMVDAGQIEYEILVTHLIGIEDEISPHVPFRKIDGRTLERSIAYVKKHRSQLGAKFKDIDSEDLAVSGIFLIMKRV